jgi:hypothetical protein
MSDFTLTLDGIEFGEFETPDRIEGGGGQRLAVHQLAGSKRTVDAFGPANLPLRWSGWFLDDGAEERCQEIDAMRVSGQAVDCSWASFSYLVVVAEFTWTYEKFYRIGYSIVLEVVEDHAQAGADEADDLESAIQGDLDDVADFSSSIGNPGLSSIVGSLLDTAGSVSSIIAAPLSFLDGFGAQIGEVSAYVGDLLDVADLGLDAVSDLVSGQDPLFAAQTLLDAADYAESAAFCFPMENSLTRLGREVVAITG